MMGMTKLSEIKAVLKRAQAANSVEKRIGERKRKTAEYKSLIKELNSLLRALKTAAKRKCRRDPSARRKH